MSVNVLAVGDRIRVPSLDAPGFAARVIAVHPQVLAKVEDTSWASPIRFNFAFAQRHRISETPT